MLTQRVEGAVDPARFGQHCPKGAARLLGVGDIGRQQVSPLAD